MKRDSYNSYGTIALNFLGVCVCVCMCVCTWGAVSREGIVYLHEKKNNIE